MLLALFLSCFADKSIDSGAIQAWRPDLQCPGDVGCESRGDGSLFAGASAVVITPNCWEKWNDDNGDNKYKASQDSFEDCGCDQLCPGDPGYTAEDPFENDGEFQTAWLAGFGNGRAVQAVHDDLWARTIVFQQGDISFALISVDLVGFFNDDLALLRQKVHDAGIDVDHILLSSTHVHAAPDVLGQWGKQLGKTGRVSTYLEYLQEQIVEGIRLAKDNVVAVDMKIGSIDVSTYSAEKRSRNVLQDNRDPKIIDPMLNVASFTNENGEVVASLLNFGNHPEVLDSRNLVITSDFVDGTRRGVENGVVYPDREIPGIGGVCVYVSGAVGGMMTPLGIEVTDGTGIAYSQSSFEKSDALGNVMAELALQALADAQDMPQPDLSLYSLSFNVPVENVLFQAAFVSGMFERQMENYEDGEMIDEDKTPLVRTEINVIDIGTLRMQSVPGELLPELAIGGYDPAAGQPFNDEQEIITPDNENPPDLSQAPQGPYIKERMGGEHNWIVGLGNDMLGYFIPPYNYKLHERSPYFEEADGDHYEETNSLGPSAFPIIEEQIDLLLDWVKEH